MKSPQSWPNKPDDYWDYLPHLEAMAIDHSLIELKEWDLLAEKCMTLAIKAPLIQGQGSNHEANKLASAFLKRSMSDFRSIWLLIKWGYLYQAACVAASLYENSLVVECIVGRKDLADKILNNKNQDVPWSAVQLSKMAAYKDLYGDIPNKLPDSDKEFDLTWKLCYHNYKLLCKMKHPTLQQVKDEADSSKNAKGQFAVLPIPDLRKDNLGLKHMLIIISIIRLIAASNSLAQAKSLKDDITYKSYHDDLINLKKELMNSMNNSKVKDMPIKAYGFKFH